MNTITDFKLAGVTWGTGDYKELTKLIDLVIKEGNNGKGMSTEIPGHALSSAALPWK